MKNNRASTITIKPKILKTSEINRKSMYQNAKVTLKRVSIVLPDRIPSAFWIFCFFSFGIIGLATYFLYFRENLKNLTGADLTDFKRNENLDDKKF